ncbi:glutathione S-transferase theta-1-like [Hemiscyllium ocellatum]|uniref:glutathione S-transferase theta-1-like n=1 Tax=Hemiscyllium ocellatum TaxID=170820 RepID=UPI0029675792|nr:glutathione S-transferase theta-1-like [Hemiscyllium ocellatum]
MQRERVTAGGREPQEGGSGWAGSGSWGFQRAADSWVSLCAGEQHSEEFRKVNPLGKVPVIKDGEFTLCESLAILKYLACKYKTPDHWYPAELQRHARVDEYLAWQHTALRPLAGKIFMMKGLFPAMMGAPCPEDKMTEAQDELAQALKSFQEKFLQERPYIAGSEISLADLVAIVDLTQPLGVGYDPLEGLSALTAWRDRVKTAVDRDLFDKTHEGVLTAQVSSLDTLKSLSQSQPETLAALKTNFMKYSSKMAKSS